MVATVGTLEVIAAVAASRAATKFAVIGVGPLLTTQTHLRIAQIIRVEIDLLLKLFAISDSIETCGTHFDQLATVIRTKIRIARLAVIAVDLTRTIEKDFHLSTFWLLLASL